MIITCKKCNSSFNLDESLLKPTGSKVRCSKCKDVFVVHPSPASKKSSKKPSEANSQKDISSPSADDLDLSDIDALFEETPDKNTTNDDMLGINEMLDTDLSPEEEMDDIAHEMKLSPDFEDNIGQEDYEPKIILILPTGFSGC